MTGEGKGGGVGTSTLEREMRMFSRSRFARGRYTCPAMLLSGSGAARLGPLEDDVSLLADAARLLLLSWRNCAQLETRCSAGAAAAQLEALRSAAAS